jgi:DHA2 family multidrug resistance protein
VTTTVLDYSVQMNHSLWSHVATPFNRALGQNAPSMMMSPQLPFGQATLNQMIEFRSEVFAFQNDFLFMFYICLPAIAIVWLMQRPRFAAGQTAKLEVME